MDFAMVLHHMPKLSRGICNLRHFQLSLHSWHFLPLRSAICHVQEALYSAKQSHKLTRKQL